MNDQEEFIGTIREIPGAPLPEFPPDPGDLFQGIEAKPVRGVPMEGLPGRSGLLGAGDPHLFRDPETGIYYTSSTGRGGGLRRSEDLIHWTYIGPGIRENVPPEADKWTRYGDRFRAYGLWAPEVYAANGRFRMYYSVSTWGHRLSYIGMAEASHPEGPYEQRGAVIRTTEASPVNAIDAGLIEDAATGELYMNYGSFWGGIRQIHLDPATGLRLEGEQDDPGRPLWRRHHSVDRAIEGCCEMYNPDTGYYYLFVSYDSTVTDYNVRVARSRCVSGPFVDHRGVPVLHTATGVEPDAVGLKIVDCYQFEDHPGWISTGHNGLLRDGERHFISFHARRGDHPKWPTVQHIHLMLFDRDGWPVVSPCLYTGERLQRIDPAAMPGAYERIVLDAPDGKHLAKPSTRMYLREDGKCLADGVFGEWRMSGDWELELRLGELLERFFVISSFDVDTNRPTLALTGRRSDGLCVWGRKRMEGRA